MDKPFRKIVLILCAVGVTLLCVLYVARVYQITHSSPQAWRHFFTKHRHHPVTEGDVVYISQWMTFDYINKVFDLPSDYLKSTLGISDQKYPLITVKTLATELNVSIYVLIPQIQESVTAFLKHPPLPPQ